MIEKIREETDEFMERMKKMIDRLFEMGI